MTITSVRESHSEPDMTPRNSHAPALALVSAAAAVLGVYGFLVGGWTDAHGYHLWAVDHARRWVNRPLGIGEDFGVFAVMLLLLVGGFRSTRREQSTRTTMARAYLPYVVTMLLGALGLGAGLAVWTTPTTADPSALLTNLPMAAHVIAGATLLVPLGWVPLAQLAGWFAAAKTTKGWTAPVLLLVAAVALVVTGHYVAGFGRAAVVASFLPLVVIGQLIGAVTAGTLRLWTAVPIGLAALELVVFAERGIAELSGWAYPITAAYAVAVFAIAVVFADETGAKIARSAVCRWLADRALWLLLLQGVVGYPIMAAWFAHAPMPTVVAAVAATGAVADLCHRLSRPLLRESRR